MRAAVVVSAGFAARFPCQLNEEDLDVNGLRRVVDLVEHGQRSLDDGLGSAEEEAVAPRIQDGQEGWLRLEVEGQDVGQILGLSPADRVDLACDPGPGFRR